MDKQRRYQKTKAMVTLAENMADLSVCKKMSVGCVIFDRSFSKVHSIGYNGPPRGTPHESCHGVQGRKCSCIHAEANALIKLDTPDKDLVLFCTVSPCPHCAGLILNSRKIDTVLFTYTWDNDQAREGIELLENRIEVQHVEIFQQIVSDPRP